MRTPPARTTAVPNARCTVTRPPPSTSARRRAIAAALPSTAMSASRLGSPRSRSRTGPPTAYAAAPAAAVRAPSHTAARGSSGPPIGSGSDTAGLYGQASRWRDLRQGDGFDLDQGAGRQAGHLDGRSSRGIGRKERAVDGVHRGEVAQIGHEDRRLHDPVEVRSGRLEHGGQVLHHPPRLGLDPPVDHRAGRRVEPDLAGAEDEARRADGLVVRRAAERLRRPLGDDHVAFAHPTLPGVRASASARTWAERPWPGKPSASASTTTASASRSHASAPTSTTSCVRRKAAGPRPDENRL